jgi:hypothetical protein
MFKVSVFHLLLAREPGAFSGENGTTGTEHRRDQIQAGNPDTNPHGFLRFAYEA